MRGRWARVEVWGDWLCIELVDVRYVVRSNCCDGLGGTC